MNGKPLKIIPALQPYAWGGDTFISSFLHIHSNNKIAEAWYGDHPLGSAIIANSNITLLEWIRSNPESLGHESFNSNRGQLPFLLKILDVKDMLSIQLHPTKKAAEIGFKFENENGIPLNAPYRNYKDQNHKPEILFALSDFWMLQGFASIDEIKTRFKNVLPDWKIDKNDDWESLLNKVLDLNTNDGFIAFKNLVSNLTKVNTGDKNQIYYWLAKAIETYPVQNDKIDIGFIVMLLLHVQYLKPGQVGYQAPGVLHAYLEGQNIELMANSDNVLRGGLTPKHIDTAELKKHIDFSHAGQCLIPAIYIMEDEAAFTPPVNDFMLKHFCVKLNVVKELQFETASILLIKSGKLRLNDREYNQGESVFIPAYEKVDVLTVSDNAEYFLSM